MPFLSRAASRPARIEPVLAGAAETRAAPLTIEQVLQVRPTASGVAVNPTMAENLSTVLACVNVLGSTMGALPAFIYRRDQGGRVEVPNHPIARLIRQPNANQTWPDLVEWLLAEVLLQGNACCALDLDGAGRIVALRPIPWRSLQVLRLPDGGIVYEESPIGKPKRRYLADEMLHLRDRSDDGLIGRSRISRAPDVLGGASALQDWSGSMWKNAATPSGAFETDASINETQFTRLRAQLAERHTGTRNARSVLILDNGLKWRPLSISPEDAEVLASRRFTVEELCRLFQVPPPIVQDYTHNTFSNATQASLWFAQLTLTPWARKIEAEFGRSVFGAGSPFELSIDLSGLMRGDYATRWQSYGIAIQNDILDRNEIREIEGFNPRAAQPAPAPASPPAPAPEPPADG